MGPLKVALNARKFPGLWALGCVCVCVSQQLVSFPFGLVFKSKEGFPKGHAHAFAQTNMRRLGLSSRLLRLNCSGSPCTKPQKLTKPCHTSTVASLKLPFQAVWKLRMWLALWNSEANSPREAFPYQHTTVKMGKDIRKILWAVTKYWLCPPCFPWVD